MTCKTDNTKVLYNISHYGYLPTIILHNAIFHKDDYSILMLDCGWLSNETLQFICEKKIIPYFDAIIKYDESKLINSHKNADINELKMIIDNYFSTIIDSNSLNLDDIDYVYSGFDTIHAFGIFLSTKSKKHTLFDINLITDNSNARLKNYNDTYHDLLCDCMALTWKSPLVTDVIYMLAETKEEIRRLLTKNNNPCKNRSFATGKNISFFTIDNGFSKITPSQKKEIIDYFGLDYPDDAMYTLLLPTSSFFVRNYDSSYSDCCTFDELFLNPYRVLLDYVRIKGKLAIKPHPNRSISKKYLELFFSDALYIPANIPSELLNYSDIKFDTILSPGSNSASTVNSNMTLTLPRSYFKIFEKIHSLSVIADLLKQMGMNHLYVMSFDEELSSSIEKTICINITADMNSADAILYYDEIEYAPTEKITVHSIKIDDYESLNNINCDAIVVVEKHLIDRYSIPDNNTEYYAISGIIEKMQLLEKWSYCKKLPRSGLIIYAHQTTLYDLKARIDTRTLIPPKYKYCQDNIRTHLHNFKEMVDCGAPSEEVLKKLRYLSEDVRIRGDGMKLAKYYLHHVEPDSQLFIETFTIIANNGDADAMGQLGQLYENGEIVSKSINDALMWYRQANKTNSKKWAIPLFNLLWKIGTPESYSEMIDVIMPLANKNDGSAMGHLGKAYRDGKGVKKDHKKAIMLFEKAVSEDITWANWVLIDLLVIQKDETSKKKAFEIALEKSPIHRKIMFRLGRMYLTGTGVKKNMTLAKKCLSIAASDGDEDAKKELQTLM